MAGGECRRASPVEEKLLVTERRERPRLVNGLVLEVPLGHATSEHGDAHDFERLRGPRSASSGDVDPDGQTREIDQLLRKRGSMLLLNRRSVRRQSIKNSRG